MLVTKRELASDGGFSRYEVDMACRELGIKPIVGALANGRAHGLTRTQAKRITAKIELRRKRRTTRNKISLKEKR